MLGWFGRVSFVAELLSRPVLVGYMTGVAAIMMVSQLGRLTGMDVAANGFSDEITYVLQHLGAVHAPALTLGLVTLVVMLAGGAVVAPHAPMALIGIVGAAAAVALFHLREQGITVIGTVPYWFPSASGAARVPRRHGVAGAHSLGRGVRRLHRQHPDRACLREPTEGTHRRPSGSCWRSGLRTSPRG